MEISIWLSNWKENKRQRRSPFRREFTYRLVYDWTAPKFMKIIRLLNPPFYVFEQTCIITIHTFCINMYMLTNWTLNCRQFWISTARFPFSSIVQFRPMSHCPCLAVRSIFNRTRKEHKFSKNNEIQKQSKSRDSSKVFMANRNFTIND